MIELYTAATPNGWKISIALEEMEIPYTVRPIDLGRGEQREDWHVALNPNGRIPTIVDHDREDFVVFESGAILLYLAERSGRFLPREENARSQVVQWLMFQMGGLGPMMGQANVFFRYAPVKLEYAIGRYQRESRRLFEVLDRRLEGRDYLVDEYSIADIANWCWARTWPWSGVSVEGLDNLQRWLDAIAQRPAVSRGLAVPPRSADPEKMVEAVRRILA